MLPKRSLALDGTLGNFQNLPIKKVFDESLRGHGWIEGKNLFIDSRYFEGHAERIPALAAELVTLKPDLLIATNTQTAVALKSATASIPIVLPQIARDLGVALPIVEASTVEELGIAFASAAAQHADAINVFGDALTLSNATRVTALAAKHRLPASYLYRQFDINGGLISYGRSIADLYLRAGGYVDKVLKGTKPSHLPVEQPTKFELVINMKTAKAIGLTVPPSLLASADEVIE